MVVSMKKKGVKLSLEGLRHKLRKLGYKLSSINDLLAEGLITFDVWENVHDVIVEKYLNTWTEISRYYERNNQGGEHEQDN